MSYGQYSADHATRTNPLKDTPKVKRQRQVFPIDEIAHLWAHQAQDSARNSQGNFYFEGPTIYSYGSHFPIAMHVTQGRRKAILFTTRGYSNTTAKHLSIVRRAIPADVQVFHVSLGGYRLDHDAHLKEYREQITDGIETVRRSRNGATWMLQNVIKTAAEMRLYAKFFKVPAGVVPLPKKRELDALRAESIVKHERAMARQEARDTESRRKREEQARLDALELPEKIARWRAGEYFGWNVKIPTMLRIKGDEVETSLGARVPLDHAKRVLPFVLQLHNKGQEWRTNGHTLHLGHYQLDRIDTDGVHAGCHHIGWDEVERFAQLPEVLSSLV